jgi:hypothetical protein
MSADFISAALALPIDLSTAEGRDPYPDFDAARSALAEITDPSHFHVDIDGVFEEDLAEILPDLEDTPVRDKDGVPRLDLLQRMGSAIIDQLCEELEGSYVDVHRIGGYRVFITGEATYGDRPEGVRVFNDVHKLPDDVLDAMGIAADPSTPLG